MLLCDTNIFIEVYRHNTRIQTELKKIGYDNIVISDITRAELFYGAINKVKPLPCITILNFLHSI